MSKTLIADSGSTKTEWCLLKGKKNKQYKTNGINPYFLSHDDCIKMLEAELSLSAEKEDISEIIFYSAGVKAPQNKNALQKVLKQHFGNPKISVETDMLGAARAVCGNEKGVTAILGTGSNSCYYNGKKIKIQQPSLGYIVGDEGSGTQMGKKVLQYFFYNTFDGDLHEAFINKYGNELPQFLEKIYKEPLANRYLASFTEFLAEHRGHYMVENIVEDSFLDFFQRNILKYREAWKYPIHFVGSVAYQFKNILYSLMDQYGLEAGNIIKSPMEGLITFHSQN